MQGGLHRTRTDQRQYPRLSHKDTTYLKTEAANGHLVVSKALKLFVGRLQTRSLSEQGIRVGWPPVRFAGSKREQCGEYFSAYERVI